MYVYRYQNRTTPFYGGPINRGLMGLGNASADAWSEFADQRAASGYAGSADEAFAKFNATGGGGGSGGGSFLDTVSTIGKALAPAATAYFQSKTPKQAQPPAQRATFFAPSTASSDAGMSTKTKLLLGGVAAFLVVMLVVNRRR